MRILPSVLWCCWLGGRKGIWPVKNLEWWGAGVVVYLELGADLHMIQLMPLPLTVSCFSKIQIGFTFLVPAHAGRPGQRAVKRVCVCVCVWWDKLQWWKKALVLRTLFMFPCAWWFFQFSSWDDDFVSNKLSWLFAVSVGIVVKIIYQSGCKWSMWILTHYNLFYSEYHTIFHSLFQCFTV